MSGLYAVLLFILTIVFTILIYSLWLRMTVNFYSIAAGNPLSDVVHKITNPLVAPLRGIFHSQQRRRSSYDWAALVVLVVVEFIKMMLLSLLHLGGIMSALDLSVFVLADLIVQPCRLFFFLILIEVIASWLSPGSPHPALNAVKSINRPFLAFGRKIIPDISGFDFSPFIIMILLQIITLFIENSLPVDIL